LHLVCALCFLLGWFALRPELWKMLGIEHKIVDGSRSKDYYVYEVCDACREHPNAGTVPRGRLKKLGGCCLEGSARGQTTGVGERR